MSKIAPDDTFKLMSCNSVKPEHFIIIGLEYEVERHGHLSDLADGPSAANGKLVLMHAGDAEAFIQYAKKKTN